jgi:hypothetical protein
MPNSCSEREKEIIRNKLLSSGRSLLVKHSESRSNPRVVGVGELEGVPFYSGFPPGEFESTRFQMVSRVSSPFDMLESTILFPFVGETVTLETPNIA